MWFDRTYFRVLRDASATHHLPRGGEPLPALDHAEGAVAQLLQEDQVLVADEAHEGLLLALSGRRRGRRLAEGGGGLGLEVRLGPLPAEHLVGGG